MSITLDRFERVALHKDIRLVSVDIFDTILLRTTTPEIKKFKKFSIEINKFIKDRYPHLNLNDKELLILRAYAARTAYRNRKLIKQSREATLDEIYKVIIFYIKTKFCIDNYDLIFIQNKLREIEISEEIADLNVNEEITQILKKALNYGKTIVAISDMYLLKEDIEIILKKYSIIDIFNKIYASSQFGYGKASGYLFDKVLSIHGCHGYQATHIGDNYISDYAVPKSKGILSFYYPRSITWRLIRKLRTKYFYFANGRFE